MRLTDRLRRNIISVAAAALLLTAGTIIAATASAGASSINTCPGTSLAVSRVGNGGAGGHGALTLIFRSRSEHRCAIHGYPGFDALGKHGHILAHALRTQYGYMGGSMHGAPTVVLKPGHYASAIVEWLNTSHSGRYSGRACARSTTVAYTPPNTTKTLHRTGSVARCGLAVHPVVPGRTGDLD